MPLHFSRLQDELEYFEDSDSLSIETLLDLMSDLYHDTADSLECEPEACACDDESALVANLIWLGTLFQKIRRAHAGTIALADSTAASQLSKISQSLELEIKALNSNLKYAGNQADRAAQLQKEKQRLEGEIASQKEKAADLELLEQDVENLREQKKTAEAAKTAAESNHKILSGKIRQLEKETRQIDEEIKRELQPKLMKANSDKSLKEIELNGVNATIQSVDKEINDLTAQIENMRKVLDNNDKNQIISNLAHQKEQLEKQAAEVRLALQKIEAAKQEIEDLKASKSKADQDLEKKIRERDELDEELKELRQQFELLGADEAKYLQKKKHCHILKTAAEQLRKDSAYLCRRTGQAAFTLDEELGAAMEAVNRYLGNISEAIRKYNEQAEGSL